VNEQAIIGKLLMLFMKLARLGDNFAIKFARF